MPVPTYSDEVMGALAAGCPGTPYSGAGSIVSANRTHMGLMDKLRGELVDIIEWIDDSRSTLAWRFPRYQNEIKNGAKLIVREGQAAVLVHNGQMADGFGPGLYELRTENMPIMSTLQGWQYGFNSPFKSEVYFVNTKPITDFRWGTANPVMIRDPDFGMVQVRANGLCVLRVAQPNIFLRQVVGTDSELTVDEIAELLRRVITLAFSDLILETNSLRSTSKAAKSTSQSSCAASSGPGSMTSTAWRSTRSR